MLSDASRLTSFDFEGLQIESSVIEEKPLDQGGRAFLIQSRFGERTIENWLSCQSADIDFAQGIAKAQKNFAQQFALDIRGISAPMHAAGVGLRFRAESSSRWSAMVWTQVDPTLQHTVVATHIADALQLVSTGRSRNVTTPRGETLIADVRVAEIQYGKIDFKQEISVLESVGERACIAGQDMIAYMRGLGVESYYRFVDHSVSRLYRDALRSRRDCVLLIGPFDENGRRHLTAMRHLLFDRGYRGIVLDDFRDAADQSFDQKVMFLSSLCQFVICVDASAAGHYLELAMCARFNLVTAVVAGDGREGLSTAMLYDLKLRNPYLRVFVGAGQDISAQTDEIISWAQLTCRTKSNDYDSIYGWRNKT